MDRINIVCSTVFISAKGCREGVGLVGFIEGCTEGPGLVELIECYTESNRFIVAAQLQLQHTSAVG